jgi:hypothetical protein
MFDNKEASMTTSEQQSTNCETSHQHQSNINYHHNNNQFLENNNQPIIHVCVTRQQQRHANINQLLVKNNATTARAEQRKINTMTKQKGQ